MKSSKLKRQIRKKALLEIKKEIEIAEYSQHMEKLEKSLIKEGKSKKEIEDALINEALLNEGWIDALSGGALSGIKSYLAKELLSSVGIKTDDFLGIFFRRNTPTLVTC